MTEPLTPEAQAALLDAVRYVLDRAQTDPNLGYYLGPGTEAFHRLCRAEALATGRAIADVERERGRDLQPAHDRREPDVLLLRRELDRYRAHYPNLPRRTDQ